MSIEQFIFATSDRAFILSVHQGNYFSFTSLPLFLLFRLYSPFDDVLLYLFKSGHDDINLFFLPALSLSRPAFHQDVLTGQVGCKSKNIRTSFSKKQLCSAGMASEIIIPLAASAGT